MDLELFKQKSRQEFPQIKTFLTALRKKKPADLDERFSQLHEETFEQIDCLSCANCCKTTSPIFNNADIERIARHLKMKPGQFTGQFLEIDEDDDYVLKKAPCPFLGEDNFCSIYEVRPKACREYPHTNRKKMHQILDLTAKNTQVCPAVLTIVQRLNKEGFSKL